MKRNRFPGGWNEARVRSVLGHYEQQTEDEAVAEGQAAFRLRDPTVIVLPKHPARNKAFVTDGGER
jgi:hypothetical protein